MTSGNRTPLIIAAIGIAIEVATIFLLSSKQIPTSVGTPLMITGMLMAFVPLFVVARRSRRR
jgi:hypothetical protein